MLALSGIFEWLSKRQPKKALWITLGIRGNAGDALIYQCTRALFDGLIDLDFRCVSDPVYIVDGQNAPKNVIIGPGGIIVQTNSSKHLHQKLAKQWDKLEDSKFYLWSTGILTTPTDEEATSVRRVMQRCRKVVVRANKEAEFICGVVPDAKPEWSPCASLFTNTLLDIKPRKKDAVVLNLDAFLFNEENFRDHPMRKFKDFAEASGLEVRSMVNAWGDHNKYLLDLFPPIDIDLPVFEDALKDGVESKDFNAIFNKALRAHPSFGERYLDCRFAFGKRLHGWLPFLSYDVPAAFIGMHTRRGMPMDYFGSNDFLCDVPRHQKMTRDELEQVSDGMIEKLKMFIAEEDRLIAEISERRGSLFDMVRKQAKKFASSLD